MQIPLYKAEGIIIRQFNLNEFDRLLVVYTKEFGKILLKAKSLRKKEAKMKELLELFNHVNLMIAHGKNIDTITGVTIINGFPNLRNHLLSLATLYYLAELIDKLIVGPEKDEKVWQLLLKSIYFLEKKQRDKTTIEKLLSRFEQSLITTLGYFPSSSSSISKNKTFPKLRIYLNDIQNLCGERIESFSFLDLLMKNNSWG